MEKGGLSDREADIVARAHREIQSRGDRPPEEEPAASPAPPAPRDRAPGSPEERIVRLMAEQRAETERRRKRMRRYGIVVPAAIAALFALWVLRMPWRR